MDWVKKAWQIGVKTMEDFVDFKRYTRSKNKEQLISAIEMCFKNGWRFHVAQEDGRRICFIWGDKRCLQ